MGLEALGCERMMINSQVQLQVLIRTQVLRFLVAREAVPEMDNGTLTRIKIETIEK
jgi:hypothetical protein